MHFCLLLASASRAWSSSASFVTSDLICVHPRSSAVSNSSLRAGAAVAWLGGEPMWWTVRHFALCMALLASLLWGQETFATEPYRMLSPSGDAPHPAVLLVPGCSGFAAVNGVNPYDERAGELQAAGYVVVFVDYLGRFSNCGHVSHAQVGEDILEAVTWTRAQAGVDPGRISVIGWSYGGGGVLAALRAMPSGPPMFAKAVMYYPDCRGETPWSAARYRRVDADGRQR